MFLCFKLAPMVSYWGEYCESVQSRLLEQVWNIKTNNLFICSTEWESSINRLKERTWLHSFGTCSNIIFFPTDYGILERHNQLDDTLGVLEMETKSFEDAKLFSWIFFPTWFALTAIQAFCFIMYNDQFHPLAKILAKSEHNNLSYLQFAR